MIRAQLPAWVEPGATFVAKRSHRFYDLESEQAKVTIEEGQGYDAIEDVTWLVVDVHAGRASAEIANMLATEEVWGVSANSAMVLEAKDIASPGENDAFKAAARVVAMQQAEKKEDHEREREHERAAFIRNTAAQMAYILAAAATRPLAIITVHEIEDVKVSISAAVNCAEHLLAVLEARGWGFK
jgi:hypothetical protein